MHESLLKGKAFSSRFWGWGRNRSPSPPLPGKGLYGAAARPGHPGDRQGGTGVTQGSPHSPACHTVFPADPAVNTKHWRPYRDRSLLSRHAEKPSGSAASPSSSWPPAVPESGSGSGGASAFCPPAVPTAAPHTRPRGLRSRGEARVRSLGSAALRGTLGTLLCPSEETSTLGHPGAARAGPVPLGNANSRRCDIGDPTAVSILLRVPRPRTPLSLLKLRGRSVPNRGSPAGPLLSPPPARLSRGAWRLHPPRRAGLPPPGYPWGLGVSSAPRGGTSHVRTEGPDPSPSPSR